MARWDLHEAGSPPSLGCENSCRTFSVVCFQGKSTVHMYLYQFDLVNLLRPPLSPQGKRKEKRVKDYVERIKNLWIFIHVENCE